MASDDRSYALFHVIASLSDARVRREIVTRGLKALIDFRNVEDPEHGEALAALGGSRTPALWDGSRLHEGEDAVLAALRDLVPPPGRGA